MQPSSLVFLVLIAIWAAYLLQHWVRRREHLVTARSVDRFSDAMRVLERRSPPSEPEGSAPRPRSYFISPARPSRPEVVVKASFLRSSVPSDQVGVRPTPVFHLLAGISARRLRALSLLASLSLAVVVLSLAAFSVVSLWSLLVVAVVLLADLAWLRHVAVSERAVGRSPAQSRRSVPDRDHAAGRGPEYFEPESALEREAEPAGDSASSPDPVSDPEPDPVVAARAERPAQATESPIEVLPLGWAPVPVPPPTYTLKAKAADRVFVPPASTEPDAIGPWSLDGMVYDCDLDELVQRRTATGA